MSAKCNCARSRQRKSSASWKLALLQHSLRRAMAYFAPKAFGATLKHRATERPIHLATRPPTLRQGFHDQIVGVVDHFLNLRRRNTAVELDRIPMFLFHVVSRTHLSLAV